MQRRDQQRIERLSGFNAELIEDFLSGNARMKSEERIDFNRLDFSCAFIDVLKWGAMNHALLAKRAYDMLPNDQRLLAETKRYISKIIGCDQSLIEKFIDGDILLNEQSATIKKICELDALLNDHLKKSVRTVKEETASGVN